MSYPDYESMIDAVTQSLQRMLGESPNKPSAMDLRRMLDDTLNTTGLIIAQPETEPAGEELANLQERWLRIATNLHATAAGLAVDMLHARDWDSYDLACQTRDSAAELARMLDDVLGGE